MLYNLTFILSKSLLVLGICIYWVSDFRLIFLASIQSLVAMMIYWILGAHDVAMTEAALNVVISTVFFWQILSRLSIKDNIQQSSNAWKVPSISFRHALTNSSFRATIKSFVVLFAVNLIDSYFSFTDRLNFDSFHNSALNQYFIANTYKDTNITSSVAALLADYRGFDTLIETLVILMGCLIIYFINQSKQQQNFRQ